MFALGAAALALSSCASMGDGTAAPATASKANHEAEIASLISRMSVERKVAQLVMPDISTITPADVRRYRFGTILNGGNSGPGNNDKAPAGEWIKLADAMWDASTAPMEDGGPVIPLLWGIDAVHGNNNVPGATIFPHNIGLGATRDRDLVRRIGAATAAEVAVTGIDWTFAPSVSVVRDDRWGRTYESYSEDPALVGRLGAAMVEGLQGKRGSPDFLSQRHVIATAKHFLGDGGTGGVDQGDTKGDMATIKAIHAAPYKPAIAAGVESVMASFSSVNGEKMHGSQQLLTGLLRRELGFRGLTVGDWNAHGQVLGCSNTDCPIALNAGLDVFMAPEEWKGLYETMVRQVRTGIIAQSRLDEAVARVLRVKFAYGLFDKPRPSARALGGRFDQLGSPEHRAIAREAVRKSLILLKNDGALPLRSNARVLVAGNGADSIARQAGGWSITWQGGGDLTNADFPGATSIYGGIAEALKAGGGQAVFAPDGETDQPVDAAIVVFGEEPYAEFLGDRKDLAYRDEASLALLKKLRARGIPVTAVFLSGRPMWVNPFLNAADAFVAAWLPGSEGGGIADLLIGNAQGRPRFDFTGRLSFSWPARCDADAGNGRDGAPLFRRGQGYGYRAAPPRRTYAADCAIYAAERLESSLFGRGRFSGLTLSASDAGGSAALVNGLGSSPGGRLVAKGVDRAAQEDSRQFNWTGPATLTLAPAAATNHDLLVDYAIDVAPQNPVRIGAQLDLRETLNVAAGKGWRQMRLPARCLGAAPWALAGEAGLSLRISAITLAPPSAYTGDCKGIF
ncbi:1,4-beta-D-glucan glucohydrolase [Sphingomonas astaxanthinifaciens DSM 22298]|uniref:1,4-beta-D-glucan glucohydrolase n=2 Tax=Sphingomonas TaxID=13687 RepID=A0ABQ5Z9Q7_9SPHN|nr:1,4-beta-D-glucan glucohydrolase [Sphingomonas astaxanthinifaciens DSM 22298]